jgi:hypothetical protein
VNIHSFHAHSTGEALVWAHLGRLPNDLKGISQADVLTRTADHHLDRSRLHHEGHALIVEAQLVDRSNVTFFRSPGDSSIRLNPLRMNCQPAVREARIAQAMPKRE